MNWKECTNPEVKSLLVRVSQSCPKPTQVASLLRNRGWRCVAYQNNR